MKISASIYSSHTDTSLEELVRELDKYHVDYFHIDCKDNLQVFDDISQIRSISKTPIDLHIIAEEAAKFWPQIIKHKIERVTFQYESLRSTLEVPKECNSKVGIALVSSTDLDAFNKYETICDFVLLMTTTPGESGKPFKKENFKRIFQFRQQFPGKQIHVDGGINDEVGFILRNLGVDCAVSGSYLVRHDSIGTAMLKLKTTENTSSYRVADFMISKADLPVLQEENATFKDTVALMESYKLGFSLLEDKDGQLRGICSNADLRRGILHKIDSLDDIDLNDIINPTPVVIRDSATIEDMLRLIKGLSFIILFLPVVDEQGRLKGAVTFNNLIRGE